MAKELLIQKAGQANNIFTQIPNGNPGDVLGHFGNENIQWVDPSAAFLGIRTYGELFWNQDSGSFNITPGGKIFFWSNQGLQNNVIVNANTGDFVVPERGIYNCRLSASVITEAVTPFQISLQVNGQSVRTLGNCQSQDSLSVRSLALGAYLGLDAGDSVRLFIARLTGGGGHKDFSAQSGSRFFIEKVG